MYPVLFSDHYLKAKILLLTTINFPITVCLGCFLTHTACFCNSIRFFSKQKLCLRNPIHCVWKWCQWVTVGRFKFLISPGQTSFLLVMHWILQYANTVCAIAAKLPRNHYLWGSGECFLFFLCKAVYSTSDGWKNRASLYDRWLARTFVIWEGRKKTSTSWISLRSGVWN